MTDVEKPDRRYLTALQKRGVYSNYEGRCAEFARCGTVFQGVKSVFCWDHTHPLGMKGGNEDENFRPLCKDCTPRKNRHDARALAKAKRQEKLRLTEGSPLAPKYERIRLKPRFHRPIKNPGFDRTRSKGLDGRVRTRSIREPHHA